MSLFLPVSTLMVQTTWSVNEWYGGSDILATEFPRAKVVCWVSVAYLSLTASDLTPEERGRVCDGRAGAV